MAASVMLATSGEGAVLRARASRVTLVPVVSMRTHPAIRRATFSSGEHSMNLNTELKSLRARVDMDAVSVRNVADADRLHADFLAAVEAAEPAEKLMLMGDNAKAVMELAAFRGELMQRRDAQAAQRETQWKAGDTRSSAALDVRTILPSHREYKANAISSEPGGGYLVVEGNANRFFDRLRPASVVLQAGPVEMAMDQGDVLLPKLKTSVSVSTVAEAGTIASSDLVFESVRLSARKFAVRSVASSEWLDDSQPAARAIVEQDHAMSLAAEIDRQMLEGDGTSSGILGLRNIAGVNITTLGSGSGATPDLDDVSDAIGRMRANNARPTAIFCHPRTWTSLSQLRATSSDGRYLIQPDPTTEARLSLFGVPVFLSSQLSITQSVTGHTDASSVYVVDMSRVVIGRRSTLSVLFDPFTYANTDQVQIRTLSRWGLALLDEEAVEVVAGCRP